ncbi:transcription termination factor MTERF15, mitochondrial [Trifolium repens]|nr:transcription termination factor MTERF15, mitochondrial [Trifolium repens]
MYYHFLIAARFTHTRTLHSTILCRNAFSIFFNSRSFTVSNTNHHQGESFTLSSFIDSCGLSPETSLKLSKKLQIRNSDDGPNAVIQLFRNNGFSDSQLSTLVKRHPFVLLSNPEKTLLPKLKFLQSFGVSITDLPKILIRNPGFLKLSVEKTLIPHYHFIRSLVRNDKKLVSVFKRWRFNFYGYSMVPNIEVLRKLGVPQSCVSLLVSNFPNEAFAKHSIFVEAVNFVKEMGFDRLKSNFVLALYVIVNMDKETWESKLKIFERWGWSKDICLLAFQKHPQYVTVSEKKIIKTMNFLVKDMGITPEDIARIPAILNRNLEKTIMPRCAVVKILKSRGLIKSSLRLSSFLIISEKTFLERYVTPFQKDLPLVLAVYEGQTESMVRNIEVLRKLGVPQRSASLFGIQFSNEAFTNHSRFEAVIGCM